MWQSYIDVSITWLSKSNPIINNNDKYYKEDRLICIETLVGITIQFVNLNFMKI